MPLLDYLTAPRRRLGAIVTPKPSTPQGANYGGDLSGWAHRVVEKVRVATVGGRLRFLPWYDPYTEETPEIREAYRRMLVESSVKAAFQTKILSVISLDVQFQPVDDDNPREQEQARFMGAAFQRPGCNFRHVGWSVLHPAVIDGHSVCEKVWEPAVEPSGIWKGKRFFRAIKAKDTRFLQLGIDPYRNVTAIRGMGYNAGRVWSPSDFIVFSYLSLFENPAGTSDFRSAYRPFVIKDTAWRLRSLHLENYTGPYLKGSYTNQDQKVALEDALVQAKAHTWCSLPPGVMVETIDLSMQNTTEFRDAIQDCDKEILIAIVGAHLQILEGQTTGGRGNTKVHKETSELIQWFLAASLTDVYRHDLVTPLSQENYHDLPPPLVSVGAVTEEAMLESLKVDEGLQRIGLQLSKGERYRAYGRQQPAEADDVLEPMPKQQQQPVPGGDAAGANPFSEVWRRFCTEGENKGMPGPCPEVGSKGDGKTPDAVHTPAVKIGSGKQPAGDDPVHSYLDAFKDPGAGESTAAEARTANAELKGEGSKFRVVPDGSGGWTAAHVNDLRQEYGAKWAVATNPLTGQPDLGDADYFRAIASLAGDKEARSYLHALNDPHAGDVTPDDVATANRELAQSESDYRIARNEEYGLWVAAPVRGGPADASPFSEAWQRFCTEGENKGKPGPCPEGGSSDKPSRKESVASARAAAAAVHEHAHGADALQGDLAQAYWDHPAVHAVEEALMEADRHENPVQVQDPATGRLRISSNLPPTPKQLVHRADDLRRVKGAAENALSVYSSGASVGSQDAEADRGKTALELRRILLWANQGLAKVAAVKEANRARRGKHAEDEDVDVFCQEGTNKGMPGPCPEAGKDTTPVAEPHIPQNLPASLQAKYLQQINDPDHAELLPALRSVTSKQEPNPALAAVKDSVQPATLTQGEKVAQQLYTFGADGPLNGALRKGQSAPEAYAKTNARLQSAFAKAPVLSQPVPVTRGMDLPPEALSSFLHAAVAAQKAGEPVQLAGYTSTATGNKLAPGFTGNVEVHIAAVHGLDMMPVSHFPQEHEFLLNHNSQFRVTRVERTRKGTYKVHMEQLPPAAKSAAPVTQEQQRGKVGTPEVPAERASPLGKLKALFGFSEEGGRHAGR